MNLGLGLGEGNKKKQKLEVVFRVLGFAQRCIDFKESFIVVLNVGVYLSSPVYSHGHGLFPWSDVCCYFTDHKQCKHQDFQRPGPRLIHAECRI